MFRCCPVGSSRVVTASGLRRRIGSRCLRLGRELGCGDPVIAESLSDDRRGHFQNVLPDRCCAASDGGDADVIDERGESVGVHRLSGPAAGEQPPGCVVGRGVHVAPAADPAM